MRIDAPPCTVVSAFSGNTPEYTFICRRGGGTRAARRELNIGSDRFIRTTVPDHILYVRGLFRKLWEKNRV